MLAASFVSNRESNASKDLFFRKRPITCRVGSNSLCVGERAFPPASGLTYCTWFCVDKFSSAQSDAHPVRLLTVCRHLQHRDDNLVCFAVFLSARDRSLLISTHELPLLSLAQGQLSYDGLTC